MRAPRTTRIALHLLALPFCWHASLPARAADPAPTVRAEVAHLLAHLERSGCEFMRNGEWHAGAKAKDHLQMKFDWLVKEDMVRTSEDFIRLGATKSSMSSEPYRVRCQAGQPLPSAAWLGQELTRYREQARPAK